MSNATVTPATRAKLARSVLTNNLHVKAGERVMVEAWTHTLPWAVAFAREARRLSAPPLILYEDEAAYWDAVGDGEDAVLGKPAAHEFAALGKTDVYIHMRGPGDGIRFNALPEAQSDRLIEYNSGWFAAASKAGLRGARLELARPYPTLARAYGVNEAKWTDELVRATLASPESLAKTAAPIAKALARGKRLRIHDDDGTDLTLGLTGAVPQSDTARATPDPKRPFTRLVNLPGGVVRVGLDQTVAEGTFVANRTDYYDDGKAMGGVFRFHNGKLTSAEFDQGQERFDTPFKTGGKGRDQPGYLSIGLNPGLHDTPQIEDIELGAVLVSVGGSQRWGGTNPSPFFGWVVNAGATVEIDGRPLPIRG